MRRGGSPGRSRSCGSRLGLGIVLMHPYFYALLRVAAGGEQILVGFLELVLIQIELRLREVQFILQHNLLGGRSRRQRGRQLGHALLVAIRLRLGFRQAILDLERFGAQGRGMCFQVAKSGSEGQGKLMVGYAQRRLRVRLLFRSCRELRELLRRGVGALVDQRGRSHCGGASVGGGERGRFRIPPSRACRNQQ